MKTPTKEKKGTWKSFFRSVRAVRLSWAWLWMAVALVFNIWLNDLYLDLPDMTASLMGGDYSGSALADAVLYYVLLGALTVISVAGQAQAQSFTSKKMRNSIWRKMLGMKMDYFDRNDPAELISTVTNDASAAGTALANDITSFIPTVYYVVMALWRIKDYHWILALSCFAVFPIKYVYAFVMGKQFEKHTARLYEKIGKLTGFLTDRIVHLPLIKTYTNEKAESKAGEETANKLLRANMRVVHLDNITIGAASVIDVIQKFITVVVAVILLQQHKIDMKMWIAFFLFSQNLFLYIDQIFDMWIRVKTVKGYFARISAVMEGEDEEDTGKTPFPESGDIRFENVTFTYPDTDAPALCDASFTVPRGSSVAVVGLCGSGKTTSISMLERFYSPDSGRILIGDTDIGDIPLSDFRKHIAYVQQDTDIFGGTLREALTYGIEREVSDAEVLAAAAKTGFSEYLCLCPDGLDTDVSAGGASMSGGQSQRLVLTREVLRGGDIILLDEPTSALDARASAVVGETVNTVFADKTLIVITHDLELAKNYDKTVVLENGRVVGEGTHSKLLSTCRIYALMNENAMKEATI